MTNQFRPAADWELANIVADAASRQLPVEIGATPALLLGPLTVEPPFRARGVGRALLERAIAEAKAQQHRLILLVGDEPYYAKVGFAKLYDEKTAITAAEMLNDRVLPFFDEHDIRVSRLLTDRGTEYCGTPQSHPFELYLALENIDHTRTKAKSPQTNGICERFNKTILQEFYQVALRRKLYRSMTDLQADLDAWMREYNTVRTHQGRWCYGKTPMQTFIDMLPVAREKLLQAA